MKTEPTDGETKSGGVAAVERALTILDAFRDSDGSLSLADLARKTDLYKSTILRLLVSLEEFSYIRRTDDGRYQLGPKIPQLAPVYQKSFRLESFVMPVLKEIVQATKESASFYVRERDTRVCLHRVDSPQAVRDHVKGGDTLPIKVGAAGKVLLRFARGAGAAHGASPQELIIATYGERQADTAALAAPVFGGGDKLMGALSISGPLVRFTDKTTPQFSAVLRDAAAALSATLGASPNPFVPAASLESVE